MEKEIEKVIKKIKSFEIYQDEPDNCRRIISEVLFLLEELIKK